MKLRIKCSFSQLKEIKSTVVGRFIPKKTAQVGTKVSQGQILGVVSALRNNNRVLAEINGLLMFILPKGATVDYGMIIAAILPLA